MKLFCAPNGVSPPAGDDALRVVLFGQPNDQTQASAGDAVAHTIRGLHLDPAPRAWDLLSIALSVVTADFAELRNRSPDGWTREFELDIAVDEPEFWNDQSDALMEALRFLTTDRWTLRFHSNGARPPVNQAVVRPTEDCVVLLSGGLDSLVGAIDLVAVGHTPYAVSQTVRGDAEKQSDFASCIGDGLSHVQLNHNATSPGVQETSQRARSLVFLVFGVLAATSLQCYHDGGNVPLFVCENGFIAINPPLTGGRLGSLSTRTAHPEFLGQIQGVLDAADIHVHIENPYAERTKGEMLRECRDQEILSSEAVRSTSCGRFQRFNYRHCGRCIPCQVRRAAFLAWGGDRDSTDYVFEAIGLQNEEHALFDDVRSVAMALAAVRVDGLDDWLGNSLSSRQIHNREELRFMLERGLSELGLLHQAYGIR